MSESRICRMSGKIGGSLDDENKQTQQKTRLMIITNTLSVPAA